MDERSSRLRRPAHLAFRGTASVAAVLAVAQPVLAGGFLQGHYELLNAHLMAAMVLATAVLLATIAAALMWRPGGAGHQPVVLCLVTLLVVVLQISVGVSRELIIHVPLGVAIVALIGRLATVAWRLPLTGSQNAARPGTVVASGNEGSKGDTSSAEVTA